MKRKELLNFMKSIVVRHRSQEISLSILYEDQDFIIINKPSLMLSVPGRNYDYREPRNIEWKNSIHSAFLTNDQTEDCRQLLHILDENGSVPRKKSVFDRWVRRQLQIENRNLVSEVWDRILAADKKLHSIDIDSIPFDRISAQELLYQYCGDVVAVHRLDCETSGALIYAKSDEVAGEFGKLFQTRMVIDLFSMSLTMSRSKRSI